MYYTFRGLSSSFFLSSKCYKNYIHPVIRLQRRTKRRRFLCWVRGSRCCAGESGWSQKELAGHLEISPSAVGMYEQGRREPSNALLLKMARLFGVSADFLLTGASTPADAPALRSLLHSTEGLLTSSGAPVAAEDRALLLCALLGDLTQSKKSSIIDGKGGAAMTDEDYMRQAIALAGEAADEGEARSGASSRMANGSSGAAATAAKQANRRSRTPSWRPLPRPARRWAAGGSGAARSMLRLSRARCAGAIINAHSACGLRCAGPEGRLLRNAGESLHHAL